MEQQKFINIIIRILSYFVVSCNVTESLRRVSFNKFQLLDFEFQVSTQQCFLLVTKVWEFLFGGVAKDGEMSANFPNKN